MRTAYISVINDDWGVLEAGGPVTTCLTHAESHYTAVPACFFSCRRSHSTTSGTVPSGTFTARSLWSGSASAPVSSPASCACGRWRGRGRALALTSTLPRYRSAWALAESQQILTIIQQFSSVTQGIVLMLCWEMGLFSEGCAVWWSFLPGHPSCGRRVYANGQ